MEAVDHGWATAVLWSVHDPVQIVVDGCLRSRFVGRYAELDQGRERPQWPPPARTGLGVQPRQQRQHLRTRQEFAYVRTTRRLAQNLASRQ